MLNINNMNSMSYASNDNALNGDTDLTIYDNNSKNLFQLEKSGIAVVISMDDHVIQNAMRAASDYVDQILVCRVYCEQRFDRWCKNYLTKNPDFFFIDQDSCDSHACLKYINKLLPGARTIIFSNASEGLRFNELLVVGARALVLRNERSDVIGHAVKALLAGHYYFSDKLVKNLSYDLHANLDNSKSKFHHENIDTNLTPREMETIISLSHSLTYEQIAKKMYVTLSTVQSHVRSIYRKLGANSKTQAVLKAKSIGII